MVTGRNWVLMSRGLSTLLMASDVPLIYGMVIVALQDRFVDLGLQTRGRHAFPASARYLRAHY